MMIESVLTEKIIGAAIEVHRWWGPGLYEEIYERSLCQELTLRGCCYESQLRLPLLYKGVSVGDDLRLDLLVEQKVVVEIVETEPVMKGQTASSSYKPAIVDNGVRVMVPPHVGVGTRIVINTDDLSYVERAKD